MALEITDLTNAKKEGDALAEAAMSSRNRELANEWKVRVARFDAAMEGKVAGLSDEALERKILEVAQKGWRTVDLADRLHDESEKVASSLLHNGRKSGAFSLGKNSDYTFVSVEDAGLKKLSAFAERVRGINPEFKVALYEYRQSWGSDTPADYHYGITIVLPAFEGCH